MSDKLDLTMLDDVGKDALQRLIITLADSKRVMGIRYSDWTLGAPSIETGISTSSGRSTGSGAPRVVGGASALGAVPSPSEQAPSTRASTRPTRAATGRSTGIMG